MKKITLWIVFSILIILTAVSAVSAQDLEEERDITEDFLDTIDYLYQEDLISTDEGEFYYLEDYESSWAQMNWYQWEYVADLEMKNFVVRTKISWQSASATPQWADSGCGFVFREKDPENHLKANIALDGSTYVNGYRNNSWLSYGKKAYSKHSVKGSAYFTLAAYDDTVTIMVDDEILATYHNVLITEPGYLAYVVVSGTNKDFGTKCTFEETEFFLFD